MTSRDLPRRDWLYIAACIYLGLPFIIFALTWLKPLVGIPLVIIVAGLWLRGVKGLPFTEAGWKLERKHVLIGIVILGVWVFLSGIGGYAFQNHDFYYRNAIFRDLIQFNWPVVYWQQSAGPASSASPVYMLDYYVGFWLPVALLGKLTGWDAANFVLFFWTCAGTALVVALMSRHLKTSLLVGVCLLILFSGMDALGVVIVRLRLPQYDPTLWPPIQFLETWASPFLNYSSFTTQLFWGFNQALPAWLLTILVFDHAPSRQILLAWCFTFFCAPLPGVTLALLILGEVLFAQESLAYTDVKGTNALTRLILGLRTRIITYLSWENILGGGLVFLVTFLYFASNVSAGHQQLVMPKLYVLAVFFAVEVGILGLLLFPAYRRDWRWYAVMLLLFLLPFVQIGSSNDFLMRASIPLLFYLMMLAGGQIIKKGYAFRIPILICLAIGVITPLFEINRSIYRSGEYYAELVQHPATVSQLVDQSPFDPTSYLMFEKAHPNSLVADDLRTLAVLRPAQTPNFIGRVEHSFFYEFLANR